MHGGHCCCVYALATTASAGYGRTRRHSKLTMHHGARTQGITSRQGRAGAKHAKHEARRPPQDRSGSPRRPAAWLTP